MAGGEPPRVAEIERDRQRVLITECVGRIEIEPREQDVVALDDIGIDAEVDHRVARVGFNDDAAVLLPSSCLLQSFCVARPGQDIAPAGRDPHSQHQ